MWASRGESEVLYFGMCRVPSHKSQAVKIMTGSEATYPTSESTQARIERALVLGLLKRRSHDCRVVGVGPGSVAEIMEGDLDVRALAGAIAEELASAKVFNGSSAALGPHARL